MQQFRNILERASSSHAREERWISQERRRLFRVRTIDIILKKRNGAFYTITGCHFAA